MAAAEWFLRLIEAYAILGAVFAAAFVTAGVSRVDAAAKASSAAFRLMIVPGVIALWPLLLNRWIGARR